jgi:DNA-binding PadR family transcriptional regulator
MKFALLALLQERPMYGYEMIKVLEEKSGGFYAPSAGSVYPTLQMLEDRGFVTSNEAEGKKVYSITDAGRAFFNEHQKESEEFAGPPWARALRHGDHQPIAEIKALRSEAMEVARLLAIAARMSFNDPGHIARLRGIIERARKDLSDMIYGTENKQEQQSSTPNVDQP